MSVEDEVSTSQSFWSSLPASSPHSNFRCQIPCVGCGTPFSKNLKGSYDGLRINAKDNLEMFVQTLKYAGFISSSLCVSLCEVCLY